VLAWATFLVGVAVLVVGILTYRQTRQWDVRDTTTSWLVEFGVLARRRVDGRVLPFDHHAPGVVVAWPDRAAEKPACPAAADEALGDHERRDQADTVAPSPVH
jgi:hypothetical protein